MKARVVHLVVVLFLEEDRLKAVAPEDLTGNVGAPALRGHRRRLDHTLQDDYNFKIGVLQVLFALAIERAVLIDLVYNSDRGDQEDAVNSTVKAHIYVHLVQRDKLALRCHSGLEKLSSYMCLDQVALP